MPRLGVDHQEERKGEQERDRIEVAFDVHRRAADDQRREHDVAVRGEQDGVTVGRRTRHRHAAERARAAGHVFQYEALAKPVLQVIGVEAEVLSRSASRGRRDHPHRALRPAVHGLLREGAASAESRQRRRAECTAKRTDELPAGPHRHSSHAIVDGAFAPWDKACMMTRRPINSAAPGGSVKTNV